MSLPVPDICSKVFIPRGFVVDTIVFRFLWVGYNLYQILLPYQDLLVILFVFFFLGALVSGVCSLVCSSLLVGVLL